MENFHNWLNNRPYWERNLWHKSITKDEIDSNDLDEVFQDLLTDHELQPVTSIRPELTFKPIVRKEESVNSNKVKLSEINSIKNVNALSESQTIKFGNGLTVFYGANGSGKTGFSRLLSNACTSKGERKILPNLKKVTDPNTVTVSANFVLSNSNELPIDIAYTEGVVDENLKKFSVFDSNSVQILIDQSNQIAFVPSFLAIFDKITPALKELEQKLSPEKSKRTRSNPTKNLLSGKTAISSFFENLNAKTTVQEIVEFARFTKEDKAKLSEIGNQILNKSKLDIPAQKKKLAQEQKDLNILKDSLSKCITIYADEYIDRINAQISDIKVKQELVKALSIKSFDNPIFTVMGNEDWKTLIKAAKLLYDNEKNDGNDIALDTCILCLRPLDFKEKELFEKYWNFLESKAEVELSDAEKNYSQNIEKFNLFLTKFPLLNETEVGVRILKDEVPDYFSALKENLGKVLALLTNWNELLRQKYLYQIEISQKLIYRKSQDCVRKRMPSRLV